MIKKQTVVLCGVLAASVIGLSGCFPLMAGGMITGAMVVSDRRTSGTVVEDNAIELKAAGNIRQTLGDRVHVNVTAYNRQVLLTGEVPSEQDKQLVEKAASVVENVTSIVNELAIAGQTTLSQRTNDTLLTSRVKANLVDARDLSANAFKVVSERGTVYLMGRVTQREATRATDIVRGTNGVQRLVRVLDVISEEELARIQPEPAPNKASGGGK